MHNKYRTFIIPVQENNEFAPRYSAEDVGLDPENVHDFWYMEWYGRQLPPKDTISPITSWADETLYTHYVTNEDIPLDDDSPDYVTRLEMTIWNVDSDTILKLLSLPGVAETETTLFHLSSILKSALKADEDITDILESIRRI